MFFLDPRLLHRYLFLALLGSLGVLAASSDLLPDSGLLERIRQEYGAPAMERVSAWGDLMRRLMHQDEMLQITEINRFFNQIPYVDDKQQWGVPDYWETPLELLIGGGDCEDYALAKYFTLRAVGVADARLRITYVRVWLPKARRVEPHMVLTYFPEPDADPLILDNVRGEILPASQRTDMTPSQSFNAEGLWAARQRGQAGRLGDPGSLRQWATMLQRVSLNQPN